MIHAGQLRAAKITPAVVARLVRQGALHPWLPRVYAVGAPLPQPLALELAVLLWLGHDAVLSGRSAAAIWGIAAAPDGEVEVTVIGRDPRDREGVDVHRVPELDARDVRLKHGLPVTAPARTVIDLAARCTDDELERAISEARVQRLLTDDDLTRALARCPRRSGTARVRAFRHAETGARITTRSEAERVLRALLAQAGLPKPETNVCLHGFRVDFLWRAHRLVIETDGYATHGHRAAFERDRARDQRLIAAGYRVLRVTWRQLEREPLAVIARIAQALALDNVA